MGRAQEHMEMRRVTTEIFFADDYPNCYILNLFDKGIVVNPHACSKVSPANSGSRLPDVVTTDD